MSINHSTAKPLITSHSIATSSMVPSSASAVHPYRTWESPEHHFDRMMKPPNYLKQPFPFALSCLSSRSGPLRAGKEDFKPQLSDKYYQSSAASVDVASNETVNPASTTSSLTRHSLTPSSILCIIMEALDSPDMVSTALPNRIQPLQSPWAAVSL